MNLAHAGDRELCVSLETGLAGDALRCQVFPPSADSWKTMWETALSEQSGGLKPKCIQKT
jgi:hypothetical protein